MQEDGLELLMLQLGCQSCACTSALGQIEPRAAREDVAECLPNYPWGHSSGSSTGVCVCAGDDVMPCFALGRNTCRRSGGKSVLRQRMEAASCAILSPIATATRN